jgi:hypothetical protein
MLQNGRIDAHQPLHNPAHIHMRPAGHLPRHDPDLTLYCNVPDQVARPKRPFPYRHPFPIFGQPGQMNLQVVLRVRVQLVPFQATTFHDPVLRLQGEEFRLSPRETLIRWIV